MTAPSPSRGRGWLLVAIAGTAVVVMGAVATAAIEMFMEQSGEIAQAREDLASYRTLIAEKPQLDARYEEVVRQERQADALLHGESTALAAASMQDLVKALVERNGGQMRSAQLLSGSFLDGIEKVEVQYELSLPLGALKGVTYELETRKPYLFLDVVEVRPETYSGSAMSTPANLRVEWTIHGYRRAEAP